MNVIALTLSETGSLASTAVWEYQKVSYTSYVVQMRLDRAQGQGRYAPKSFQPVSRNQKPFFLQTDTTFYSVSLSKGKALQSVSPYTLYFL